MGRVLRHNVIVGKPTRYGTLVSLMAGQEVPDWAEEQLEGADHLFEEEKKETEKAAPRKIEHKKEKAEESGDVEPPARSASAATWRKFAAAVGVKLPKGASRDDIIERIQESIPDLELED